MANKIFAVIVIALLIYVVIIAGPELLYGCESTIDTLEGAIPTEPILPMPE